jgi:hypothetical protein
VDAAVNGDGDTRGGPAHEAARRAAGNGRRHFAEPEHTTDWWAARRAIRRPKTRWDGTDGLGGGVRRIGQISARRDRSPPDLSRLFGRRQNLESGLAWGETEFDERRPTDEAMIWRCRRNRGSTKGTLGVMREQKYMVIQEVARGGETTVVDASAVLDRLFLKLLEMSRISSDILEHVRFRRS